MADETNVSLGIPSQNGSFEIPTGARQRFDAIQAAGGRPRYYRTKHGTMAVMDTASIGRRHRLERSERAVLLDGIRRKPLVTLMQLDAFLGLGGDDDLMRPDEDGDWLCAGARREFRNTENVRLSVPLNTSPEDVCRVLRKMIAWIERKPSLLAGEPPAPATEAGESSLF